MKKNNYKISIEFAQNQENLLNAIRKRREMIEKIAMDGISNNENEHSLVMAICSYLSAQFHYDDWKKEYPDANVNLN